MSSNNSIPKSVPNHNPNTPLRAKSTLAHSPPSRRPEAEAAREKSSNKRSAQSTAVTKSIYFNDEDQVSKLEDILGRYPRASMSSLLCQFVAVFVPLAQAQAIDGNRQIVLPQGTKFYI